MLSTGKQLPLEEAKKYNKKLINFRLNSSISGCIDTWACKNCGILVTDSICLCIGMFTCPKCGFENNIKKLSNIGTIFYTSTNMTEELYNLIKSKLVQIQDEGDYHSNSLATEILEEIEKSEKRRAEITAKIPSVEELELLKQDQEERSFREWCNEEGI